MINGETLDKIKMGLDRCLACREYRDCIGCPYGGPRKRGSSPCDCEVKKDIQVYIQQLETELEPLRKAKEENRLIILPYAPGTPVYIVDDYEVVKMQYHPSMYGRRCHTSKEELYKEFYKEIGVEHL